MDTTLLVIHANNMRMRTDTTNGNKDAQHYSTNIN